MSCGIAVVHTVTQYVLYLVPGTYYLRTYLAVPGIIVAVRNLSMVRYDIIFLLYSYVL